MHDVFSANTTKLSFDEGLHVQPGFRLSSGIAEAMIELQEMDFQLFKEMLACDYKEIEYRQKGFNESAIDALHEGVFEKIANGINKVIQWIIRTVKSIWHTIVGFVVNICKRIKFFFSAVKDYKPTPEDLKFKVKWIDKSNLEKRYDQFMKLDGVFDKIFGTIEDNSESARKNAEFVTKEFHIESEPKEVEIGSVEALKSPRAVFDTTLWIENISRRANSQADHLISQIKKMEDLTRSKGTSDSEEDRLDYACWKLYGEAVTGSCNLFKQDIADELKACSQVMAHFQKCYEASKKKEEGKSESASLMDDDFIREMTDYDFEQAYENCYIDSIGAVVCNF